MKLKELFYGLGLKPDLKEYSFDLDSFALPKDGEVQFARWRHPKERRKHITQAAVDALRAYVQPGDVCVDIGAHTGDTTLPMGLAAGPSGAVFALEPNPYVFKILLANSALNRKKANIYPLMFAATPEDGEFEFEYSDPGFCNGGYHPGVEHWRHGHFFKLRVQGRRLVDYLKSEFPNDYPRIRFIKIDTEGFDRAVAASIKELLASNRPFLRSEIYQHLAPEQRYGYFDELTALGYRIHKFNGDEDYQGLELTRDDMTRWEHYDILAVPRL
jgi:FkbM family methyltransferase